MLYYDGRRVRSPKIIRERDGYDFDVAFLAHLPKIEPVMMKI
jgi:hypothetical protein